MSPMIDTLLSEMEDASEDQLNALAEALEKIGMVRRIEYDKMSDENEAIARIRYLCEEFKLALNRLREVGKV